MTPSGEESFIPSWPVVLRQDLEVRKELHMSGVTLAAAFGLGTETTRQ